MKARVEMKGGAKVVYRDFREGGWKKFGRLLPILFTAFVEYKDFGSPKGADLQRRPQSQEFFTNWVDVEDGVNERRTETNFRRDFVRDRR